MKKDDKQIEKVALLSAKGQGRLERYYQYVLACERASTIYHKLDKSPITSARLWMFVAGVGTVLLTIMVVGMIAANTLDDSRLVIQIVGIIGGLYALTFVFLAVGRAIKRIGGAVLT